MAFAEADRPPPEERMTGISGEKSILRFGMTLAAE